MAGVPGRSGGANRLPVTEHLLRGTFRPDRHGPRPPRQVSPWVALEGGASPAKRFPPAAIFRGLQGRGRAFVRALYREYDEIGPTDETLITLCAQLLDDAAEARAKKDTRSSREAMRLFLSAFARLALPRVDR